MGKSARVKRLAMKDARWYMCTILHIVLSEASETSSTAYGPLTVSIIPENPEPRSEEFHKVEARRDPRPELGHLLDKGISNALYRLVTKCKKTASSPRHDETRGGEFNSIRGDGVLGHPEGNMGKERQESYAQLQGRASDRMITPTKGRVPGKPEAQSATGDNRPDVDADNGPSLDVGVNAGGRPATQSGRVQGAESVPLGRMTSNCPEIVRDDEMIDLDEVEYGMLLGVIERYWIWSESSEILTA
ncbi:hypothetical protein BDZ94DRAFT_331514 [Collybia nuda]|uniref:Uncharacterized protein n=1 Tax=Collybia nuda TaxID=64659 RepID=A0A9P5XTF5_9AGAR|nr:hypothetical protein BDZ94DRAFT_331514 [Collybia nuda]